MALVSNFGGVVASMMIALLVHLPYQVISTSRTASTVEGFRAGLCASSVHMHGYECQEFQVRTDDGYILSMHRIPPHRSSSVVGSNGPKTSRPSPPVLLQHGLLVDGMTWLLNSPGQSLALILADSGFDVWISNIRGTRFSRRHVTLNPNTNPEFWDWTWDDLIMNDLPAVINFIFKQTGQKLHYVGHSLGTLMALASFSSGNEKQVVDKVKSAALLSPIAYLSHMTTAFGVVAARSFVGEITTMFGLAEFNPKGEPVAIFIKAICAQPGVDCYDLLTELTGKNCCLNSTVVDLFLNTEPQPTSTKNLVHLAQTVRDGRLAKYDYGNANFNLEHYGNVKPPAYDLSTIPRDLPIFLSYGGRDALSDVKDMEALLDDLKNHDIDKLHVQYIKDYAHVDFIMGLTANDLVYNQIIKFFNNQQ